MKNTLQDYADAFEAHSNALHKEIQIKQLVIKTHYHLLLAKEAIRAMEWELLSEKV